MMNLDYTKGLTTVDWLWFFGAAFLFWFFVQFLKERFKGGDFEKLLKIPDFFHALDEPSLAQLVDLYRQGGMTQVEQSFQESKSKGIKELALRLSQFEDHALLRSVYEDRFQMAVSEGPQTYMDRLTTFQRVLSGVVAIALVIIAPIPYFNFAQTLCIGAGFLAVGGLTWIQLENQKSKAQFVIGELKKSRKMLLRNLVLIQLGVTSKHALD